MFRSYFLTALVGIALGSSAAYPQAAQPASADSGLGMQLSPIKFEEVPREIGKLPTLRSPKPLYALFLFGLKGEARVWCVLDQSNPNETAYDVLYIDRNANGDLTEADERFATESVNSSCKFALGNLIDPGQKDVLHTEFTINWQKDRSGKKNSVRYSLKWRGEKRTFGPFGPYSHEYETFASSPSEAPIFVPGYDRPFEFAHWRSDKATPGEDLDFKVFVGQRGGSRGSFSSVDDKFLPEGQFVQATLFYKNKRGKEERVQALLTARC